MTLWEQSAKILNAAQIWVVKMFEMCSHDIMCLKRHLRTYFVFESQRTDLPINTKPFFNQYEMPLKEIVSSNFQLDYHITACIIGFIIVGLICMIDRSAESTVIQDQNADMSSLRAISDITAAIR